MDNGGLRPEYEKHHAKPSQFYDSLRKHEKSPIKYLKDPLRDGADMTTYLNWPSMKARLQSIDTAKKQQDLVERLTRVSPRHQNKLTYNRNFKESFKSISPRRYQAALQDEQTP